MPADADRVVADGMRVAWMKVWASAIDHPKFVHLNLEELGAWLILAMRGCASQPRRGELVSRDHAAALIERDGKVEDGGRLVDRLVAEELLDVLPGGRIALHDFDSWQVPPSQTREANRARKQASRERQRGGSHKGPLVTDSGVSQGEKREKRETALERVSLFERTRARLTAARPSQSETSTRGSATTSTH